MWYIWYIEQGTFARTSERQVTPPRWVNITSAQPIELRRVVASDHGKQNNHRDTLATLKQLNPI